MWYSSNESKLISRLRVSSLMTTNCRHIALSLPNILSLVLLAPVVISYVVPTLRQQQSNRSLFANRFCCSRGSHFTRELGINLRWEWGKHVRYLDSRYLC